MPHQPSVTVVIPAYNAERYLSQTIRSVLEQSLQDFELVVVDDGSVDGTLEVARSFVDPRLVILSGPNQGVAAARNRGLQIAQAPWIAFLDADDLWYPSKLDRQVETLLSTQAVAVGTFMTYLGPSGRTFGRTGICVEPAVQRDIAAGRLMPFAISSILFDTSVVVRLGGFDVSLHRRIPGLVEDIDLLSRVAREGRIVTVEEVLGAYRVHAAAASATDFASQRLGIRFVEARRQAEDRGASLSWEQFRGSYRPGWRRRQKDLAAGWYRRAGLERAQGRRMRAVASLIAAGCVDPTYALPRIMRQAPWRHHDPPSA